MSKTAAQLREEIAALEQRLKEAERQEQREAEEAARIERMHKNRSAATHLISVAAAFKEALKALKSADPEIFVLNSAWLEIPQQAQPRETNIAKQFDLSETERDNAKERGRKAIRGL